jgi:hypothetical protein
VVDPRKLLDYALSSSHSIGRFKATFFAKLGFTAQNWEEFSLQLREMARNQPASPGERTAFGQKYVIRGTIRGPAALSAEVVTVWIVLHGEEAPRLVTVYPRT